MSVVDLENFLARTKSEPRDVEEPSTIDELVGQREDVGAVVAQKQMEDRFQWWKEGVWMEKPYLDYRDIDPEYMVRTAEEQGKDIIFALDYPSRVWRSLLAISGLTARADRFGDIRRSQGFWSAMGDLVRQNPAFLGVSAIETERDIISRAGEQVKKIPEFLTDRDVPRDTLPSFGHLVTEVIPQLEPHEWVYDVIGELAVEHYAIKGSFKLAKGAWNKVTTGVWDTGDDIIKKGGFKRLLGSLDDEEMRALQDSIDFRRVGKLGTKPARKEIDDAVGKMFQYIDETESSRLVKKETISAKRKQAAARMYKIQGQEYGPGYSARMTKEGATTATEKAYTPLNKISARAVDGEMVLQRVIDNFDFGGSKIYTTVNAQKALAKLYEYGELLTTGEVEMMRGIFGDAFAESLYKVTALPAGNAGKVVEIGRKGIRGLNAAARTLETTGELSFLGRQANFRMWTRPKDAVRSFAIAMRSLASPKYANRIDEAMRFTRTGKIGLEHDLFLGHWQNINRLNPREEFFAAEWLHHIPILKQYIGGFERGYVNGLNSIRLDWFDEGLQIIERTGRGTDDDLLRGWANYVNNMTGRADIDAIEAGAVGLQKMADTAKDILYAPRFTASKWNRHKVAAELIFGENTPRALKQMMVRDVATKWRRYERFAWYASQNGYTVESNPQSSDFLKLKKGDTRIDVLGGDGQLVVMMARIVSGQTKDSHTGLLKDNVATKIIQQYSAGKLNPLWSTMYDKFIAQQTFEGKNIDDPEVLKKLVVEKFLPLFYTDIKDKIYNEYGRKAKVIAENIQEQGVSHLTETLREVAVGGFIGLGVQTYGPSARKQYELMIEDKAQEIYSKHFLDLTIFQKQDVVFEAENDDFDKTELLKEEMGMHRQSPGAAARLIRIRDKSFRQIRKGLGKHYQLFEESNVRINEFPIDIGDIRLSTKQHAHLGDLYVKIIKQELKHYPNLAQMPSKDYTRRMDLEYIENYARQEAIASLKWGE